MGLRRPQWWRDCLAISWRAKQRGQLNTQFTDPAGKFYRLPDSFKTYYYQKVTHEEAPVHYELTPGRWERDPETRLHRHVENRAIPLIYPDESHQGLWGGEGVVKGYFREQDRLRIWSQPMIWWPRLRREVFHSEILNQHLLITCTTRTLDLVDDCHGFDHYILKTHEVDLKSRLGITLKKQMLHTLLDDNLSEVYPDDAELRQRIYNRYEHYIIPRDQIQWIGVTPNQALIRIIKGEEAETREGRRPLKDVYKQQLLEELQQRLQEESSDTKEGTTGSSILSALRRPFSSAERKTS